MYKFRKFSAADHRDAFSAQSKAEAARHSLIRRLDALAALVPAELAEQHGVQTLLEEAKGDIGDQVYATDWMISYIPREFRRSEASAILAAKVFGTPELLERILLHTPTSTILASYGTTKDFYNTIEGSPKLQRRLGLMPDPDAHISFKANAFVHKHICGTGWEMRSTQDMDTDFGVITSLTFTASCAADAVIMKPGKRLAKILLTQPPVKRLDICVPCCCPANDRYAGYGASCKPHTTTTNDTGITIGEVRNVVVKLTKAHRMCPRASPGMHNREGFVEPVIKFTGDVLLAEDDYSVVAQRESKGAVRRRANEEDEFEIRIHECVRAKRAADEHYLPIPTLAEYEAGKARRGGVPKGA